jgi:xylulose-5-phosphate/fructose-6-phosphate phosphoketolase
MPSAGSEPRKPRPGSRSGRRRGRSTAGELERIRAWWRAANYLATGQIYLLDKPRLFGHWGTTPGPNLVWAHATRRIRAYDLDAVFVAGPEHGGPGPNAAAWLEGTYSELYSHISRDEREMARLFRQFAFPGGVPSHCAPETPGSFHQGEELGYAPLHAFGAVLDNPGMVAFCVVGDGEAETGSWRPAGKWVSCSIPSTTGPLSRCCTSTGSRSPIRRCRRGSPRTTWCRCCAATATTRRWSAGMTRSWCTSSWPPRSTASSTKIGAIQHAARSGDGGPRPVRWPMVALRTPTGWTGAIEVDSLPVEGTFRAHQAPLPNVRTHRVQLAALRQWLESYRPGDRRTV